MDFGKAASEDLVELLCKDPEVMVPFFVMITGLSHREFKRRGLGGVYSLRRTRYREKLRPLADLVRSLLAHPLRLEAVLYKFYNWEEHQRRHWRGRRAEKRGMWGCKGALRKRGKIRASVRWEEAGDRLRGAAG